MSTNLLKYTAGQRAFRRRFYELLGSKKFEIWQTYDYSNGFGDENMAVQIVHDGRFLECIVGNFSDSIARELLCERAWNQYVAEERNWRPVVSMNGSDLPYPHGYIFHL